MEDDRCFGHLRVHRSAIGRMLRRTKSRNGDIEHNPASINKCSRADRNLFNVVTFAVWSRSMTCFWSPGVDSLVNRLSLGTV
jgi:hypothetical protein